MSIDAINAYFRREGMRAAINNVMPCSEVEAGMLKSRDPVLRMLCDRFAALRLLWVKIANQSNILTDRLHHEIPTMPAAFNNHVLEWDNGTRWTLRHVV